MMSSCSLWDNQNTQKRYWYKTVYSFFSELYQLKLYKQAAKSGPEKLIGDTLRNNPDNFISTMAEIKTKLATGKYSFVNV